MGLYNFELIKNGVNITCQVLTVIQNTNYAAIYFDEQQNIVKSNFPFWLFIQTDDDKYFLPGLPFIIANPQLGLERYIGYALESDCTALPTEKNPSFNPFMPPEVTDSVKQLLGVE